MTVLWDGIAAPRCQARPDGADRPEEAAAAETPNPVADPGPDPHDECLDEMSAALIGGRRPETDAYDNLWTVAMLDGALRSAESGEMVRLTD